jgi:glycine/sarcosine N-methyltransferase
MASSVVQFYGQLTDDYHLLWEDWAQSVRGQGAILDRLLRDRLGDGPLSVLDCCCGIGTQALGLALHGHRVHATDVTAPAVARAAREAAALGVEVTFGVADVRILAEQVVGTYDAVLACDNALPHLLTDEDLDRGVRGMAAKLRPGGLFVASTRDYDALVQERPRATPVRVHATPPFRRVVFQVWDWTADGRTYHMHLFLLKDTPTGWQAAQYATDYRALLRAEFTAALVRAGLSEVCWQMPDESGFYQPVVTARKP